MATPVSTAIPTKVPSSSPPQLKHPYIGVLAVFLGAGIATLNARLISIGLADMRGAVGIDFDQAAWIPTALNMATMFSGVFVVFVNALLGPRKILLPAATVFTIASALIPFTSHLWLILTLVTIAGLASGTFYSLTMTFVLTALPKRLIIFGIAAYAADIVFISNIASLLQGWYVEHLSWRWIFWTAAVATPAMILCVYIGIPARNVPASPLPSWRGFIYFSSGLALLYGALDQGERLDWLHSGIIVGMLTAGLFLVAATWARRMLQPNPLVKLDFLWSRNIIILGLSIFVFKFAHLATVVLVPAFLGTIQHYRPLQTGVSLAWVALPMFVIVWVVAATIVYTNARLILASGLTIAAVSCWMCSRLDSSWSGGSFRLVEVLLAIGFACAYVGLVSSLVLEGLEAGALTSIAKAATFSGFLHCVRIFGGQIGVTVMNRFIAVREQLDSNLLGLNVQGGSSLTYDRLRLLSAGFLPTSIGSDEAQTRAVAILSQQVRAQAYTLAIRDSFVLISWLAVFYMLLMLFLRPVRISYGDLRKMQ